MSNLLDKLKENNLATQISTTNPRFTVWNNIVMKIQLLHTVSEDKAVLYVTESRGINPYCYRTSLIESISYKDDIITVKTRNSVYKFMTKDSLKLSPTELKFNSYIEGYDN